MSETASIAGRVLLGGALAYALLTIGAHFLSLAMIFPRPPVKYAPGPGILELTAADGVKIAAKYWVNPKARYTMLYLHGNYEDLGSLEEYIPNMTEHGYSVFAIDYRRYGLSGGVPTEQNVCDDAVLAYDYLREQLKVPAEQIVIFGYSLGGGPGTELARRRPAAGLVLQGAFVSAYRVMTKVSLFPGDKFNNLSKIPEVKMPVMIIHGTADQTVPFWHGQALYDAVRTRKTKLFIEGGPHTRLADFTGPRYWDELRKFVDSLDAPK
jgi:fermentation-respiration switch protein FrsA (DUF1100 family)